MPSATIFRKMGDKERERGAAAAERESGQVRAGCTSSLGLGFPSDPPDSGRQEARATERPWQSEGSVEVAKCTSSRGVKAACIEGYRLLNNPPEQRETRVKATERQRRSGSAVGAGPRVPLPAALQSAAFADCWGLLPSQPSQPADCNAAGRGTLGLALTALPLRRCRSVAFAECYNLLIRLTVTSREEVLLAPLQPRSRSAAAAPSLSLSLPAVPADC